jgi:enoyl-CoA hydratase
MQYFLLDQTDNIAILTMNQPKSFNVFSLEVQKEFLEVLNEIEKNEQIKGLIITGAGSAFAAGADIKQMLKMNKNEAVELSKLGQTVFNKIENLKAITVAAINGAAVGGGCELALACDYRIAAEGTKLGQAEITIGIIPGWGASRRLARIVGLPAARDMIFTGRLLSAEEALNKKLVDHVVSKEKLLETAKSFLKELLSKSPLILQYAKKALKAGITLPDEQADLKEQELFGLCFETEDRIEGMKAFLEKRKPDFKGR